MLFHILPLCPPLRRWVYRLRPGDWYYHPVRRLLELGRIWINRYDPEWDHFISTAIDLGMAAPEYTCSAPNPSNHIILVGDIEVWIANFPYAAGEPWKGPTVHRSIRPSIMTLYRLRDAARAAHRAKIAHMQHMENTHV